MTFSTPGVRQDVASSSWREHLFGLSAERWAALGGHAFWVTGAGTGFGQAIAVALALAGARVFLTGRRQQKLAETRELAVSLGASAESCDLLPCDITDQSRLADAAQQIDRRHVPLRGLVHCAALPPPGGSAWPLQDLPAATWDAFMRINVTAPWLLTRLAMTRMIPGGGARILLLSSEAGWAWTPKFGPYNVSKAALNNLGMSLAAEYAASNPDSDVQINVLVPGEARTEMNQGSINSPFTVVAMALLLVSHPPGGPNGFLFHRDGRHLPFGHRGQYENPLM